MYKGVEEGGGRESALSKKIYISGKITQLRSLN